MTPVAAPCVELRLLTHFPSEMARWWAALLEATPASAGARATAITGACLRVVIERSQIAFDYHPEASGVTGINLVLPDIAEVRRTANRLAQIDSHPHRATRQGDGTMLWFRDPNGTDVCLTVPGAVSRGQGPGPWAASDELDPKAVLDYATQHTGASGNRSNPP